MLSQMPHSKGQETWASEWKEREKDASSGSQLALGVATSKVVRLRDCS